MRNNGQNNNQTFLDEYIGQIRRTLIHLLAWGALVVLSSYLAGNIFMIPGFLFGFASSIVYYILMCQRVKKSSSMPPAQAVTYMRYGWIIRLSFVVAVLIISLKIPGIDFLAAAAGLFSLQIVIAMQAIAIVIVGFISKYKA